MSRHHATFLEPMGADLPGATHRLEAQAPRAAVFMHVALFKAGPRIPTAGGPAANNCGVRDVQFGSASHVIPMGGGYRGAEAS